MQRICAEIVLIAVDAHMHICACTEMDADAFANTRLDTHMHVHAHTHIHTHTQHTHTHARAGERRGGRGAVTTNVSFVSFFQYLCSPVEDLLEIKNKKKEDKHHTHLHSLTHACNR